DGEPHHRPARLPEAWFDAEQGGAVPMFHLRARRPRLEAYFLRSAVLGWLYSRGAVSGPQRRPSRDNQPSTERMDGPASVEMEVAARSNHIGRGSEHSRRAGPMVLRAGACSRFKGRGRGFPPGARHQTVARFLQRHGRHTERVSVPRPEAKMRCRLRIRRRAMRSETCWFSCGEPLGRTTVVNPVKNVPSGFDEGALG